MKGEKWSDMAKDSVIGLDIGGSNIKFTMLTPQRTGYLVSGGIVNAPYMDLELEHIVKRFLTENAEDVSCVGVITSYPVSCGDYYKGVERIVTLFSELLPETPVFFIDFESRMWPLQEVMSTNPARFAMANFLGSAYLASKIRDNAIVMDTGSTSTDILLTRDNVPVAIGKDTGNIRRNLTGEATWTGIITTLISSLTQSVPLRGRWTPGSPRGGTTNDVYNILYYDTMRDLLRMYGVKQKKIEDYYLNIASLFVFDLENIERTEIENVARYVSTKHVGTVAGFLLQVLSFHNLDLKDTDFVLMGIGKDILLKKVLTLLDVPRSQVFDSEDHVPGDFWAHGSSVGAALRTLDYTTGECVPLSALKGGTAHENNLLEPDR